MKDEQLFPTFANFLCGELETFLLCTDEAERPVIGKKLLENEKDYAWTFTNNFIMEYRDEFNCDITSLHNFAIGFIRIMCTKNKETRKSGTKTRNRKKLVLPV